MSAVPVELVAVVALIRLEDQDLKACLHRLLQMVPEVVGHVHPSEDHLQDRQGPAVVPVASDRLVAALQEQVA